MRLRELVWTTEIEEKVQGKHGLRPEEVSQACLDPASHVRRARGGRYAVLGRTDAGRYVLMIGAYLGGGTLRVITARNMTAGERDLYERHA